MATPAPSLPAPAPLDPPVTEINELLATAAVPRRRVSMRDVAWALTLAAVLTAGILVTLLLQTAMQGQARIAQQERAQLTLLRQQRIHLTRQVDRQAQPQVLARRARRLHMRPQIEPRFRGTPRGHRGG